MKIDKNKLIRIMIQKKMDYTKLSEVSGVRKSTISRTLNAVTTSRIKTVIAIAEALGVEYTEFVDMEGEK